MPAAARRGHRAFAEADAALQADPADFDTYGEKMPRRAQLTSRPAAPLSAGGSPTTTTTTTSTTTTTTAASAPRRRVRRLVAPGPLVTCRSAAGWSSLVARRAHNPKVVGSNPTPATNESRSEALSAHGEGLSAVVVYHRMRYADGPDAVRSRFMLDIVAPVAG